MTSRRIESGAGGTGQAELGSAGRAAGPRGRMRPAVRWRMRPAMKGRTRMQLAKKEMDRGPLVSGTMGWSRGGDGWRKLLDFFILWLAK